MTGTDLYKRTHKSVPVIFEPPCTINTKKEHNRSKYKRPSDKKSQRIVIKKKKINFPSLLSWPPWTASVV